MYFFAFPEWRPGGINFFIIAIDLFRHLLFFHSISLAMILLRKWKSIKIHHKPKDWGKSRLTISSIQPCESRTMTAGELRRTAEGCRRQGRHQGLITVICQEGKCHVPVSTELTALFKSIDTTNKHNIKTRI